MNTDDKEFTKLMHLTTQGLGCLWWLADSCFKLAAFVIAFFWLATWCENGGHFDKTLQVLSQFDWMSMFIYTNALMLCVFGFSLWYTLDKQTKKTIHFLNQFIQLPANESSAAKRLLLNAFKNHSTRLQRLTHVWCEGWGPLNSWAASRIYQHQKKILNKIKHQNHS